MLRYVKYMRARTHARMITMTVGCMRGGEDDNEGNVTIGGSYVVIVHTRERERERTVHSAITIQYYTYVVTRELISTGRVQPTFCCIRRSVRNGNRSLRSKACELNRLGKVELHGAGVGELR